MPGGQVEIVNVLRADRMHENRHLEMKAACLDAPHTGRLSPYTHDRLNLRAQNPEGTQACNFYLWRELLLLPIVGCRLASVLCQTTDTLQCALQQDR